MCLQPDTEVVEIIKIILQMFSSTKSREPLQFKMVITVKVKKGM